MGFTKCSSNEKTGFIFVFMFGILKILSNTEAKITREERKEA
jgi:hypothetical protein